MGWVGQAARAQAGRLAIKYARLAQIRLLDCKYQTAFVKSSGQRVLPYTSEAESVRMEQPSEVHDAKVRKADKKNAEQARRKTHDPGIPELLSVEERKTCFSACERGR